MKSLLALVCLFCLANNARAVDGIISCTGPEKNTDGSVIADLAGWKLYGAFTNTVRQTVAAPGPCRFVETNLSPGEHRWYATAFNAAGVESAPTNPVSVMVDAPPPPPPVFATVSTVAYTVTSGNDRLTFLIVGSVPLGTPCIATESANAFNVVPRASVTFDGPTRPKTVLARCSAT